MGVFFYDVTASTVNNCHFNGAWSGAGNTGIEDYETPGGNSYNNNTFVAVDSPVTVTCVPQSQTPLVLDHCQFSPPSN
jgi:hypothetical protein